MGDSGGARRARGIGGFVVIVALVVVLGGVAGYGPLSSLRRSSKSSLPTVTVPPDGAGGTTTTVLTLERRAYKHGDCVVWDQKPSADPANTRVVPCTAPHLFEVGSRLDLTGRFDHFPTKPEWKLIFVHDCGASVQALLGAPLDPTGRFVPGGITPTRSGWEQGDRVVWCGAELGAPDP